MEPTGNYQRLVREWRPDVIGISNNYLANVPEVIDLAKAAKATRPETYVFVGGHSASFVAAGVARSRRRCDRLRAQRGRGGVTGRS